ncbi:hypothetical protein B296_00024914 [Ensete ventricosum]|uniref:Uncharacterized protein n=1 Tax=Ensete ventricosum TaxID=4639 RepID=A0A427A748_ENSVE|nr:hypothetical protein B296_00024914 [Ensete ventricosum]
MFDFHKVKGRLAGRTLNCPAPPSSAVEECPAVAGERHPASMGEKHPGKGGSETSWKKKKKSPYQSPRVRLSPGKRQKMGASLQRELADKRSHGISRLPSHHKGIMRDG